MRFFSVARLGEHPAWQSWSWSRSGYTVLEGKQHSVKAGFVSMDGCSDHAIQPANACPEIQNR